MDFVFSHKKNLLKKYEKKGAYNVIKSIKELVNMKKGELFLIDELNGKLKRFNFKKRVEPKRLKKFFDAIDKDSKEENTFLLVGGHSIIPFYKVENPTDDEDKEIFTDAPYASRDTDFLIPQRAFGRIPDSKGKKADFLIRLLEQTKEYYKKSAGYKESFGYSASIWKEASKAVFRVIGDEKKLKVSPPFNAKQLKKNWLKKKYLYFNLHGSKETPNWYGQKAPGDAPDLPIYPVAITPEKVPTLKRSCIYTEACYGAWIFKKLREESMALKFLSHGTIAFVGSTAIAYGPPAPPSREADLLGKYFLQYVKQGIPFGDALKNAKIDFAKKMIRAQGFLDDDDKKTLLEFQLYGDPSLGFPKKRMKIV
ncbi:MAG: hypothetical protein E3J87_06640 [Candidatus Cloacimonadota bacterium]|nr:MAG: hypothetical protein E3J87_06640 [Candidatus Cloacimonadota bacterium]